MKIQKNLFINFYKSSLLLLSLIIVGSCRNSSSAPAASSSTNTAPTATAQSISASVSTTYTSDGSSKPNLAGTDPEGTTVTCAKATNPSHGSVTVNSNCTFVYVPTTAYSGADSFTFTVSDGSLTSAAATVSITVSAVATGDSGTASLPKLSTGVLFLEFAADPSDTFGNYPFTGAGGVTYVTKAGRLGKVAHFNGVDGYLTRAFDVAVPMNEPSDHYFSISFWFSTVATGTQVILDEQNQGSSDYVQIHLTNGVLTAGFSTGPTEVLLNSTQTTLNNGSWHHVVFVRNEKRMGQLYIDNSLSAEDTDPSGSGGGVDPTSDLYIGRNVSGTSYFDGYLDDLYWQDSAYGTASGYFDATDVSTMYNR